MGFNDLKAQLLYIKDKIDAEINRVLYYIKYCDSSSAIFL